MSTETQTLELRVREVGPQPSNAYALVCPHTRQSVLIDPGDDPEVLLEMLHGTTPIAILISHAHYLHIHALDEMRAALKVPVLAHPGPRPMAIEVDRTLADGELLHVGEHTLKVIYTPGHTPDIVCFALQGDSRVVVSDAMFSPGQPWTAEDAPQMIESLRTIIMRWPDDTICHTGHGPAFRLGDRRRTLEAFLSVDHPELGADAKWELP